MKEDILNALKELTSHSHVTLTPRGNFSIRIALVLAKGQQKTKVLIPDQGGWITYKQFPEELGLELVEVKTHDALIDLEDLNEKADEKSVFLYENPGGYFVEEPIEDIYTLCKEKGCLVILDASGGIGTTMCDGRFADIIIGSFGRWKPVNAEYGGFISSSHFALPEVEIDERKLPLIKKKIDELPQRIVFLNEKRDKVLDDLKEFDIVYPGSKGYVVVVKGDDEKLDQVKQYCNREGLEFTECPRYIRINERAVSIEVKRL